MAQSKPPTSTSILLAKLVLQQDGSFRYGDIVIPTEAVRACADTGSIIIVPIGADGPTQIHMGMTQIGAGLQPKDPFKILDGMKTLQHGVHTFLEIGLAHMVPAVKTAKAQGLVEAGFAAAAVMVGYPNQSWNARDTVEAGNLSANTTALQIHFGLQEIYTAGQTRVSRGVGYLSDRVYGGASTVYKVIAEVLPSNDALAEAAKNLASYFQETVAKALDTKKTNKKQKQKMVAAVTQNVKDQAYSAARQEVEGEVNGALQNFIQKKSGV